MKRVNRHSCPTLMTGSLLANVRLMVSNRKMPQLQGACSLANDRAEVGDMLEHITAVCEIELAVRHGQPLTESNPIVDIETGKSGMATCRLDRHCGAIYPNHPAVAAREFFGQKAATAADVEGMQVFKVET